MGIDRCLKFKGKKQGKPYAKETQVNFLLKNIKSTLRLVDIHYVSKVGRLSFYVKGFVDKN